MPIFFIKKRAKDNFTTAVSIFCVECKLFIFRASFLASLFSLKGREDECTSLWTFDLGKMKKMLVWGGKSVATIFRQKKEKKKRQEKRAGERVFGGYQKSPNSCFF